MNKPTVVFLAAGKNSRFFPLNSIEHKGFITLMGKSLLEHAVDDLAKRGYTDYVIVVAPKTNESDFFQDIVNSLSANISVSVVVQHEPKGQGDALLCAKSAIPGDFILASPYYTNAGELADALVAAKKTKNADCVFSGITTDHPELYGVISHEGDRVTAITEKPQPGTEPSSIRINSIYLFNQSFFETLQNVPSNEYSLETACTEHAQKQFITFVMNEENIPTLKYAWHLFEIQSKLQQGLQSFIAPSAHVHPTMIIDETQGPVMIAPHVQIGAYAHVKGPIYIGENARIGEYTFVRSSFIEANAIVGSNTEVVRSLILLNSTLHFGYFADSILGERSKVGAGIITSNKRLDGAPIRTLVNDKMVETGKRKLGAIIGNDATVGIRTSFMPGILIGSEAVIYPEKTVAKNVGVQEILK